MEISTMKPTHPKTPWFVQQRLLEGVEKFADLLSC